MVEQIGYPEGINQIKSFTQIEILSNTQMLDVVARTLKDIHSTISEPTGWRNHEGRRIKPSLHRPLPSRDPSFADPIRQASESVCSRWIRARELRRKKDSGSLKTDRIQLPASDYMIA
jgi:hypothetical protein